MFLIDSIVVTHLFLLSVAIVGDTRRARILEWEEERERQPLYTLVEMDRERESLLYVSLQAQWGAGGDGGARRTQSALCLLVTLCWAQQPPPSQLFRPFVHRSLFCFFVLKSQERFWYDLFHFCSTFFFVCAAISQKFIIFVQLGHSSFLDFSGKEIFWDCIPKFLICL